MSVSGVAGEDAIRLPGAVGNREGARNAIRIETMQVPTGRQDRRRADEIAADDRGDETSIKRTQERGSFVVLAEQPVEAGNSSNALRASCVCGAGNAARAASADPVAMIARTAAPAWGRPNALSAIADNVSARSSAPGVFPRTCRPCGMSVYSSSRIAAPSLSISSARAAPRAARLGEIDRGGLRLDEFGEQAPLMIGLGLAGAIAVERRLQIHQPAIEPGMGQARREIADEGRGRSALGERALGGVVRGIEIDVGHGADQPVGPACSREPDLLARHELERAVHPEMQHHVGVEVLAQVAVEGREGVRRSEPALEQQAHGVALVTHRRLNRDQHVAEPLAEHEQRCAVRLMPAWRRAPLRFDLRKMRLATDVIVDRDASDDIGVGAEARVVALDDPPAQLVDGVGDLDGVTVLLHRLQGAMQATRRRRETPPCPWRRRWAGS